MTLFEKDCSTLTKELNDLLKSYKACPFGDGNGCCSDTDPSTAPKEQVNFCANLVKLIDSKAKEVAAACSPQYRINLNTNVNLQQQTEPSKNINLLSALFAGGQQQQQTTPNTIKNLSDAKREAIEDSINQLDRVRSSQMSKLRGCESGKCIQEVGTDCCWNNSECNDIYCTPPSSTPFGCCSDPDCHLRGRIPCCKCYKYCADLGDGSGVLKYYPKSVKLSSWPDAGKHGCANNLQGDQIKLCNASDPCGTGDCTGYPWLWEETVGSADTVVINGISAEVIEPVYCGQITWASHVDAAIYGCSSSTDSGCSSGDIECLTKSRKPINIDPSSDAYSCILNECDSCDKSITLCQRLGCSCETTVAYYDDNGIAVFCNELTPSETEKYYQCKLWQDWNSGCSTSCPSDCTNVEPSNPLYNCNLYFNCINKLGDFAAGKRCEDCDCGDNPCSFSSCLSTTKTEYQSCLNNCKCSNLCCNNPCSICGTDYWTCISNPNCVAAGCCSKDCTRDCGSIPCTSPNANCRKALNDQNGCCACADSACATTTIQQYNNCVNNSSCLSQSCCKNPCSTTKGTLASSEINSVATYDQCINKQGIFSTITDTNCCGTFQCSYCGADKDICSNPDSRCTGCCACVNSICPTNTIPEYLSCLTNTRCTSQSCCRNPCVTTTGATAQSHINSIATYDACINKTGIFSTVTDVTCCGPFQCSYCGSTPCSITDIRCTNPSNPSGDCCACNDSICSTTTIAQYNSCLSNSSCTSQSCCRNPCITSNGTFAASEINSTTTYDACIAKTGIFSTITDTGCCGSFQCSYCSNPCSSTDIRCKNPSNPSGDCCECNNSTCLSLTRTQYLSCLEENKLGKCLACCADPCSHMPSITTVNEFIQCKAAESGANNKYKPFTDKGCSCGSFTCSLCTPTPCENPDPLCQNISCCTCNKSTCETDTKLKYDTCRTTPECRDAGCCVNPCINAPKDYNECIRSPYASKGCCLDIPPGPCDLCTYCRDTGGVCATIELYNQCISSSLCSANNCCISPVSEDPCEGCSDDCNSCRANATCVANGCCSGFNCGNLNCPSSNTIEGWRACKQNGCCNDTGCCVYPCTNCPKDYTTCMQNSFCKNAGCCIPPNNPCDTCNYENNNDCLNDLNCASNGCCQPPVCEGCLDADPNSYYQCILNSNCLNNGCCGSAPCITNNCYSRTKAEYEACIKNPDCIPPQQSAEHPCCVNPCLGCSTNYFECNRNPACVAAGCCPSSPTCLDCKTDPAHPNDSCTHPDPRCSNAPDNTIVAGCCNCKSNRCQDDTRDQYITCINKQNKSFCMDTWGTGQPCCTNPCSTCPPYKESSYPACIVSPGCANKGCCLEPPPDPCAGCKDNPNCSSISECVRKACCKETPVCETCSSTYSTCITQPSCVSNGCCPPDPCIICNRNNTKEGYAECSSNESCIANNCCNNPCDVCSNYYYKECVSDIYCSANDCCPPPPCSVCSDNYEECISNPICRLYCCCKGEN